MPSQKRSKTIFDTNLWISFLIGRELQNLKNLIVNDNIQLITTDQLITELRVVTSRRKLRKYFAPEKVEELVSLLNIISEKVKLGEIESVCRDPKDDFLLALAKQGNADYLVTGDNDLLELKEYGKTKILTLSQFKRKFN